MRAGAYALSLLSVPLNVEVLRALEGESKSLTDLRRAIGSPAQTTMRVHLKALNDLGVLERRRQTQFPGSVDNELGGPGRDLLNVATVVERWLDECPAGPLSLGSPAAKGAIKALVEGWSSKVVRALAARPLSLTELSRLISSLNYPSVERRLGALRLSGLIEPEPTQGRSTPYAVSTWLRHAVAPVLAAASWERRYAAERVGAFGKLDIEAAFLLALPDLDLGDDTLAGQCRLAVEIRSSGGATDFAGALVGVHRGSVTSCVARLEGAAEAWVSGSTSAWLEALTTHRLERLEIGGDCALALALLDRLYLKLFGMRQKALPPA